MKSTLIGGLKGNARGCLKYEPFFLIPYSMYSTYATLYMHQLGLKETGIGLIASLGLFVSLFASLFSGYLTDRMGRKRALLVFDLVSWTAATLIWAVAQNVWFFVAAALVNGFAKIPNTAFYCLLVEDTPPEERSRVFTLLQLISVVGGLFAPLGGLIVSQFTLIPGVRAMYVLACLMMTYQFLGRNRETHETEIGYRKMAEIKERRAAKSGISGYLSDIRPLFRNRPLLLLFGVYILFHFQSTLNSTFLSLYLVDQLKINEGVLSLFPAMSSVVMLLSLRFLLPRIGPQAVHRAMRWGFGFSLVSVIVLLLAPASGYGLIAVSTAVGAIGTILSGPYLETAVANALDDNNRANLFAILTVLILLFTSPAGMIGGWTYRINPAIPFMLVAASFALATLLLTLHRIAAKRAERASVGA
ncbi:MFS transporter [Gorillibacterium sp. sgz500922]|uniref:MFS transporter n=1 Tax=Gorillibacterium sp. sgz500922 TaxID=3446694 RepID=UPI003F677CA7